MPLILHVLVAPAAETFTTDLTSLGVDLLIKALAWSSETKGGLGRNLSAEGFSGVIRCLV